MGQQALKTAEYDDGPGGDDTLLPDQFWNALGDLRAEPEKRLMVAVLEEAIALIVNAPSGPDDERGAAIREARRWFASEDRGSPFAFATICDILGLEISCVRQALSSWAQRERLYTRPRLQAGRGRHQVRSGERTRRRAA